MPAKLTTLSPKLMKAKLPVLDSTIVRFEDLLEKKSTVHAHLAEIIRGDLGFTLDVFREANHKLPEGRDPVKTVEHSIAIVSAPRVITIGKELTRMSELEERSVTAIKKLYSIAAHASAYFIALANQLNLPRDLTEDGAKKIRLMNFAEVLLWTNRPADIASYKKAKPYKESFDLEQILDKDLRYLGLELAEKWLLPAPLIEALTPFDEDNRFASAMILADRLATWSAEDWHSRHLKRLIEIWSEWVEIPTEALHTLMHRLAADTARQLQGTDLPVSAFTIFFPPLAEDSDIAPEQTGKIDTGETETSETNNNQELIIDDIPPATKPKPAADIEIQSPPKSKPQPRPAATPAQSKPKAKATLQSIMTMQLKKIRQQVDVDRVLFAMLNKEQTALQVSFALGGKKPEPICSFKADLTEKNIFSLLMKKPQGMQITAANLAKYAPLFSEQDKNTFHLENLLAMSIFVKNKPIGLIIADSKTPLQAVHYQSFKSLCNKTMNLLGGNP